MKVLQNNKWTYIIITWNKCLVLLHVWYLILFLDKTLRLYYPVRNTTDKVAEPTKTEISAYREKNMFGLWKMVTTSFEMQIALSSTTYVSKSNTSLVKAIYWKKIEARELIWNFSSFQMGFKLVLWCLVWHK